MLNGDPAEIDVAAASGVDRTSRAEISILASFSGGDTRSVKPSGEAPSHEARSGPQLSPSEDCPAMPSEFFLGGGEQGRQQVGGIPGIVSRSQERKGVLLSPACTRWLWIPPGAQPAVRVPQPGTDWGQSVLFQEPKLLAPPFTYK